MSLVADCAVVPVPSRAAVRLPRSARAVAGGAAAAVALVVLGRQLRDVDWAALLAGLDAPMVLLAVVAALVSVTGAAWNLIGFSPVRIGLASAWAAQLAGTAAKVVTPASVGAVAVNARLLQRAGVPAATSVLSVAATQVAQLAVTAALVVAVVAVEGPGVLPLPDVPPALPAAAVLVVAAGAGTAPSWWHRVPAALRTHLAAVGPLLADVVREPRRCLAGIGGCVVLTAGLVTALWASVRAGGGHLPVLAVLVVLLAGTAVGSSVPTPGGVGGVEAAMSAGLVAAGLSPAEAVPAVVLFRTATFWLVVPAGVLAAAVLGRRSRL